MNVCGAFFKPEFCGASVLLSLQLEAHLDAKGGKRKGLVHVGSGAAICPHAAASSHCFNIDNRLKGEKEGKMDKEKRRSEQLG